MRPATNLIATQGTPPPAMPGQDQRLVDVRIRLCAAAAKTRCLGRRGFARGDMVRRTRTNEANACRRNLEGLQRPSSVLGGVCCTSATPEGSEGDVNLYRIQQICPAVRAQKAVYLSRKSDRERKRTLRVHQKCQEATLTARLGPEQNSLFHPQTTMGQPCSKCGVQRKPGARLADECDSDVGGTKNRCCNCEFEKYNKRERGHCVHCIARESGASDCEP